MKLTDEELIAAIESEESLALDAYTGELQNERTDALARYRGLPLGNEVEGRSQVVDKSVLDTIEWIMPSLTRVYMGGDDIGQFEAIGPEDEEAAKQETEVCNWFLENKNDLFSHVGATLRDGLLLKNGYMVGYHNKREDTRTERYEGKSAEEMALMQQDPEVTIVEQNPSEKIDPYTGRPLFDLVVEQNYCDEYPAVESIPPDELLVSRRHRWTSVLDADFVQWRRRVTIGQLRAEGFDIPDDLPSEENYSEEWTNRARYNENQSDDDTTSDPSRRYVNFHDTYIRIDLKGKGTPQLWRVCYVGGTKRTVLKEEANIVPFAAFSPIIYPHSHIGMSVYDLINDISVIMTQMTRQYVDSNALALNPRMATDITRVNIDDLLSSRVGGVVRTEGNPAEILMPLVSPDVGPTALAGLEYMSTLKEQRTGVTRYSAGLDANSLNKTATGAQQIQAAANQRIELIARTFAGGFRDLFLIVHSLLQTHCSKPITIKLRGGWTTVNPREWKRRTDFKINVGLGTGTSSEQVQKLMMMAQSAPSLIQMNLMGPEEVYNLANETWKALGYKHSHKFLKEPQKAPKIDPQTGQPVMGPDGRPVMEAQMPPPPKDPKVQAEEMRIQAEQQKLQATIQADAQKFQAEAGLKQQEMQAQAALDRERNSQELQVQAANDQRQALLDERKAQLDLVKIEMEDKRERERMILEAQLKREEMQLTHEREQAALAQQGYVAEREMGIKERDVGVKEYGARQKDAEIATNKEAKKPVKGYKVIRGSDGRASKLEVEH